MTLDQLTDIYASGTRFGARMIVPFKRIRKSVNNGEAIKLWRYERFSEKRLSSLSQSLVYLSTPDKFNDPADSMPSFDMNAIRQRIKRDVTPEGVIHSFKKQKELGIIDDPEIQERALAIAIENFAENKQKLLQATEDELLDRYRVFRKEIHCACFSEDPRNPTMWAHYADNWKGFVAGYEIKPSDICCQCNACNGSGDMPFTLAPILYEKRYDMSLFSAVLMDSCKAFPYPTFDVYLTLVNSTIHKDERWSNEREWRLFTGACNHMEGDMFATMKPTEVILGSEVADANAAAMRNICNNLGIGLSKISLNAAAADYEYDIVASDWPHNQQAKQNTANESPA